MMRTGLPVRRYLVAILAAAVGFIAISVVDQRDVFIDAWGLAPRATAVPTAAEVEAGKPAERAVRTFVGALEAAYQRGAVDALDAIPVAADLRGEVAAELANPVTRSASAGLTLTRLEVLRAEPQAPDVWEVTTDETWTPPAGRRNRLRFRYKLARRGDRWRINEMTPLLPEPVNETRR